MNTTELHISSNRVRDIERYCLTELQELYPEGEIRMFVRMMFEAWMGWSLTDFLVHRDETINQSDLLRFHWAVEDLKRQRPIQQIIGWTEFCGCRIEVDENTLIPRPETEEIVRKTIAMHEGRTPKRILDLCTGSGCIAIALAKEWSNAEVTAVDISGKALDKARENAENNNVRVDFIQMDLLQDDVPTPPFPFDLIISNPPYVMQQERSTMQRNVLNWEPAEALFVPNEDPLKFYKAIANIAKKHLAADGLLVLEINEHLGHETMHLLKKDGFEGTIHDDFRGKARMLFLHRNR